MTRLTAIATLPLFICTGCGSITRSFYNSPWRTRWQQPEAVIHSLALQPGDHVADLGAGGGYFTFRLADAVGPHGKVYAVDIDKGNLDYIARRAQQHGYTNIETILAKPDDPLLPPNSVDVIFTCNTYHHLERRTDYFASAARYLRPGGRVAIIDLNGKGWLHRLFLFGHWTPKETSRKELEAAGYKLTNDFDFLDRQIFQVFKKSA
ncbi:MAG TPA: class I SAM-dependent methyltransferase [Methylomirabilota bacterium]|jgi:ubiquinone/menaquinone biosynthesis C-methylase UbiE|nr:class I SAM-dependent methyltransferase [Methylomirabilota bacterium]